MIKNPKTTFDNILVIAKISHELRNPIHGIKGICNVLLDNWPLFDDEMKKSSIDTIYQAICDLENLANKLFDSNKDIQCYLEKADLIEIAQKTIDTVKRFNPNDTNKVKVFLKTEIKELYSNFDPFWIGQVLNNLIVNALKHSKGQNIKIKIDANDQEIIASVIDDGIGVPENELDFIFAPFKQSTNTEIKNKGSGLGLAICQQIVEAHNGKIWAVNNKDGGLNISIILPQM